MATCVALALGTPRAALAQSHGRGATAAPAAPADPPREWYGWQTLMVDGMSILTFTMGQLAGTDAYGISAIAMGSGVVGYAVGGPLVHAAHGHPGRASGSLLMRLGSPVLGALTGAVVASVASSGCHGELCDLTYGLYGAAVGAAGGAAAAVVVDSVALASEPAQPEPERASRVRWTPTGSYDPRHRAATLGVSGSF